MEKEKEQEKGERWRAAIVNLSEMASNLDSLQRILTKKAVFVEEDTFAKASLSSEQVRTIKTLEQRIETLERELDAAIAAAARARTEKRQAEAAQRAAELRAQDVTKELENTTSWQGCKRSGYGCYLTNRELRVLDPLGDQGNLAMSSVHEARPLTGTYYTLGLLHLWLSDSADRLLQRREEVFKLHMEELRSNQEEISKKDEEVKLLEAIIQTLSRNGLSSADD